MVGTIPASALEYDDWRRNDESGIHVQANSWLGAVRSTAMWLCPVIVVARHQLQDETASGQQRGRPIACFPALHRLVSTTRCGGTRHSRTRTDIAASREGQCHRRGCQVALGAGGQHVDAGRSVLLKTRRNPPV